MAVTVPHRTRPRPVCASGVRWSPARASSLTAGLSFRIFLPLERLPPAPFITPSKYFCCFWLLLRFLPFFATRLPLTKPLNYCTSRFVIYGVAKNKNFRESEREAANGKQAVWPYFLTAWVTDQPQGLSWLDRCGGRWHRGWFFHTAIFYLLFYSEQKSSFLTQNTGIECKLQTISYHSFSGTNVPFLQLNYPFLSHCHWATLHLHLLSTVGQKQTNKKNNSGEWKRGNE